MKMIAKFTALMIGLAAAAPALAAITKNEIYRKEDPSPFVNGELSAQEVFAERQRFLRNFNVTLASFGFEIPELPGSTGPAPARVEFAGTGNSIFADLSTSGMVKQGDESGRFNTTPGGMQYLRVNSDDDGTLTFTFNKAISAFGFFGTDIGDFGGSLEMLMYAEDGSIDKWQVRAGDGVKGAGNNLLFFGFAGIDLRYTKVSFVSKGDVERGDYFGFDDFYVADAGQFNTPAGVPEPGSLALAGLALLAAGVARQRRRRN